MNENPLKHPYLVIEGNIGAGKTSLATILSRIFNTNLVLESFAENTFLPQFYKEPERFAFPLEMSFLAERYGQIHREQQIALSAGQKLVGDYIFEKSLLFASVNLKGDELDLFTRFFRMIEGGLKQPDLLVYLHKNSGKLLENIRKRGRPYEQEISADYLDKISHRYLNHLKTIENHSVIIIDSDNLDFVNDPSHLRFILDVLSNETNKGIKHITFRP
ncbi:MAG: hypothetical protein RLZZ630_1486 [Bacteroidota bacterium]|jgi:deoxyadenosine/deoxycytidine kinase